MLCFSGKAHTVFSSWSSFSLRLLSFDLFIDANLLLLTGKKKIPPIGARIASKNAFWKVRLKLPDQMVMLCTAQ